MIKRFYASSVIVIALFVLLGCSFKKSPRRIKSSPLRTRFSKTEAMKMGEKIGIVWVKSPFSTEQFRIGMGVELEHGKRDAKTNVTNDDPLLIAKIAWVHLMEFPDYYTRLLKMEEEGERYWKVQTAKGKSKLMPRVVSTKTTKKKLKFTSAQAMNIGRRIGINWAKSPFDVEQFRVGLDVELEHGKRHTKTNVTNNDPILTAKIAWVHLKEFPDYYTRLLKMEEAGEKAHRAAAKRLH